MKDNYPLLLARSTQDLTLATLRVTDGRQGKADTPKARVRAFQLTLEEARAAPNVIILSVILWYSYVYDSTRYVLSELLVYSSAF